MFIPEYFKIYELVPKWDYVTFGDRMFGVLDDRALKTLDALRRRFGSMTINDYKWGGKNQYRGLRTRSYWKSNESFDKSRSQHKYGRAFDVTFKNATSEEVRKYVLEHPDEFPYITFLEIDISWFHFDVRNGDGVVCWSPDRGVVSNTQYLKEGDK